jgi:glycosyltransferase involved in cell wall biosynthesis
MAAKHRLLVVTESLGVGGTETHLARILPRLAACGWSVAVFCLSRGDEHADELVSSGVQVVHRNKARRKSRRKPLGLAYAATSLFRFMRRWDPKIAHFYLPGPYVLGAPIALAARVPVKVMSRRSLSDYQLNWPKVTRIERMLHGSMDALIGNSRAVTAQLASEGVPESKIKLIYNGVNFPVIPIQRQEARQALGLDIHALIGVVVANLIRYKGHADLLVGLGQIAPRLPSPWQLLIIGRDEGLRSKLEDIAIRAGIADNVQFLDQRPDALQFMAAADFGVLPSHEEGFSNVLLESMASGLAMVATSVGGNPDAILDERTGLLVPPRNPTALGEAVMRLVRDPALRKALGDAGRLRVEREFSIDRCAKAHDDLYRALLERYFHPAADLRIDVTAGI